MSENNDLCDACAGGPSHRGNKNIVSVSEESITFLCCKCGHKHTIFGYIVLDWLRGFRRQLDETDQRTVIRVNRVFRAREKAIRQRPSLTELKKERDRLVQLAADCERMAAKIYRTLKTL